MILKNIILCPSHSGQLKKGVKYFPYIIKSQIKPKYKVINTFINKNNIIHDNTQIYNNCIKYKNHICIGGDHSITIGTGAASLNKYKNIKFIWIDAHADINTYSSSHSKNYHGMPLAYLTGIERDTRFSFIKNKLSFKNLCYIGLRDVDIYERKVINNKNINTISWESVNSDYYNCYEMYLKKFINNSPVHISFDVDSINPKYIYLPQVHQL